MSEVIEQTENVVQETTVENEEVVDGGNLPSQREEQELSLKGFEITGEIQEKYFKNGKLHGRFENISGMAEALLSVENKYSSVMREISEGKYVKPEQVQPSAEPAEANVLETARPLIDSFIQNGMELTDEILISAKEQGIDVRDVKLAAIELKEQVNKAYGIVGGESEYKAMVEWGKANLSDKEKSAFDKDLSGTMGEWAIRGLYSMYKESGVTSEPADRIRGDSPNIGIRPYGNLNEVLRDRAYLNSRDGSNDAKARELHNKRLNITPDNVLKSR
jgi:hypothetical protein